MQAQKPSNREKKIEKKNLKIETLTLETRGHCCQSGLRPSHYCSRRIHTHGWGGGGGEVTGSAYEKRERQTHSSCRHHRKDPSRLTPPSSPTAVLIQAHCRRLSTPSLPEPAVTAALTGAHLPLPMSLCCESGRRTSE